MPNRRRGNEACRAFGLWACAWATRQPRAEAIVSRTGQDQTGPTFPPKKSKTRTTDRFSSLKRLGVQLNQAEPGPLGSVHLQDWVCNNLVVGKNGCNHWVIKSFALCLNISFYLKLLSQAVHWVEPKKTVNRGLNQFDVRSTAQAERHHCSHLPPRSLHPMPLLLCGSAVVWRRDSDQDGKMQ